MRNTSGKGPEYRLQIKTNENNASKYTYPLIMVVFGISQWVLVGKDRRMTQRENSF